MAETRPKITVDVDVNAPLFWKSIDSKMPEHEAVVLLWATPFDCGCFDYTYELGCLDSDGDVFRALEDGRKLTVTHWAELPGAPE